MIDFCVSDKHRGVHINGSWMNEGPSPIPLALSYWHLVPAVLKLIPELQLLSRCLVRCNGPGPSLTSLCGAGWGGATELLPFWLPKVQEGKKKRMREGRSRTLKSLPLEQSLRTAEAVLSAGDHRMEAERPVPWFRRLWEVLTRLVGFKVESIESECGSKDRARLFPRAKVLNWENSKTRVRTGTSLKNCQGAGSKSLFG